MSNRIIITLLALALTSCVAIKVNNQNLPESVDTKSENEHGEGVGETITMPVSIPSTWTVPGGDSKSLRELTWDLMHQKIWIQFDLNRSEVHGKTELRLANLSPDNRSLIIDSKTTDIKSIINVETESPIPFLRDSSTVRITLTDSYNVGDILIIGIEFVSSPPNRGLYFVNPTGVTPNKPTQIWTLGQPEDNSFWLPTVDHPAERTTTEMWISVPEKFTTISNGMLIRSAVESGSELRTDYWVMNKPHAPYLIALAVGEYVSSEFLKDDIIYKYYVEPPFAKHIDAIYAETDEMMQFFNRQLNYKYPWSIYAQVPVRDYIANGMENTTLSIYKEQIQVTTEQSKDVHFRDLLVHELIHHWFGNLVTSKDWANLPLNEGFATYFETIYRDYRDGETDAAWKSILDRNDYFGESKRFRRPIIFDEYNVPEDMYDRHTYEKAALVLRMLHHDVGDEMWWKILNSYLTSNEFDSVDWADLKNEFNSNTGSDYTEFFEQWFLKNGHPEFKVTYNYEGEWPTIRFEQVQDLNKSDVFKTKMILNYSDISHNAYFKEVEITSRDTTFIIPVHSDSTSYLVADPNRIILAEYEENIDMNEAISRLAHSSIMLRYEAVNVLKPLLAQNENLIEILIDAYKYEQYGEQRLHIFRALADYLDHNHLGFIESVNVNSEEYYAIRILTADLSAKIRGINGNTYLNELSKDPSYYVAHHVNSKLSSN
ncbi:MAG TPA: hypothetical protein DCE78_10200 [Bacteroidetes bacterium]|nr:hypothetical protein [Bacteroidota bacterium]